MKKFGVIAAVAMLAAPAFAQGEERLAKLETIVITADKAQPADYKVDAKTAALLAEIAKETKEKKK